MYCTIIYPLRERFQLTNSEYVILETIGHMSHVKRFGFWCVASAKQLSQYTTYSISTVSRCIQRLEDKGLLEKRKSTQSDTAIRPTDLWNDIIADTALMEKMKLSDYSDSPSFKMNDTLSHSEAPLIQNDSPPSFKMNDNTNNNTYMNTNTNTTYNVARANDNKISSILAANKHIRKLQDGTRTPPTPLLPGGEELAVDELPYGISVPVAAPELHPFLVALIGIAREIGVEIRWHSLQDQLREAIGLWGESVIEKEFRDYSSFIKTLVNKNVRWDSFKKNRLDKLPTVKMLADVKSARQGKPVVSKPSVVYDEDAWQYMNAIKRGEVLRSQETLDILKEKMRRYADGSMKQVIIDFVDKFIIT